MDVDPPAPPAAEPASTEPAVPAPSADETSTEAVAPGDDAAPTTAKAPPLALGDALPSITLQNEKGEDVDVAALAAERGLVLFLVPKADTRASSRLGFEHGMRADERYGQLGARTRRVGSGIYIPILRRRGMGCTA